LKLSRQEEVDYLSKNGVHLGKKPNATLGTSVGGSCSQRPIKPPAVLQQREEETLTEKEKLSKRQN
jgi:hypothetical protein